MSGLFVHTLTADDKYSVLNKDNFLQHLQMILSQKRKTFSQFFFYLFIYLFFFFWVFEIDIQFWTFSKKRWPLKLMYFWTSRLRKTWLDKYLKSLVSEDRSTSNTGNTLKQCWNLNDRNLTIFVDHSEDNSVGKVSLSDMQNLETLS